MTTIVIDVKNAKVYSDTLTTITTTKKERTVLGMCKETTSWKSINDGYTPKMISHEKFIVVGTGCLGTLHDFSRDYPNELPKPSGKVIINVLSKRDDCIHYLEFETVLHKRKWWQLKDKWGWKCTQGIYRNGYVTLGSGGQYAFGSLLTGATPEEAIKIASRLDCGTSNNVDVRYIP